MAGFMGRSEDGGSRKKRNPFVRPLDKVDEEEEDSGSGSASSSSSASLSSSSTPTKKPGGASGVAGGVVGGGVMGSFYDNLWRPSVESAPSAPEIIGAGAEYPNAAMSVNSASGTPTSTASASYTESLAASYGVPVAVIASALAQGRGIYNAVQEYKKGHGNQQMAVAEGLSNAPGSMMPVSGINQIAGKPIGSRDAIRIGTLTNPITAPFAAPLAAADAVGINFWSGKDRDQVARDVIRKALKGAGALDENYNLTLDSGTKFDIGRDGSVKNYNIDWSKQTPELDILVGSVNPLAAIITGGNSKLTSDYAGYFTNAIQSGSGGLSDAKGLYTQMGYDKDSAIEAVNKLDIYEGTKAAYVNGINQLFGGGEKKKVEEEDEGDGGGGDGGRSTDSGFVKPWYWSPTSGVPGTQEVVSSPGSLGNLGDPTAGQSEVLQHNTSTPTEDTGSEFVFSPLKYSAKKAYKKNPFLREFF